MCLHQPFDLLPIQPRFIHSNQDPEQRYIQLKEVVKMMDIRHIEEPCDLILVEKSVKVLYMGVERNRQDDHPRQQSMQHHSLFQLPKRQIRVVEQRVHQRQENHRCYPDRYHVDGED